MIISNDSKIPQDQLLAGIFEILEAIYGQSPWSKEQLLADYQQPNTLYFWLSKGEQVIGFLALQDLLGEMELTHIALLPSYQGQGLSKQLMASLASLSVPIFLEVRQSNQKAQALYQQFGFVPVGCRKHYYHDPIEDAILMKRKGR